jgi:hypothetical protein
LIYVHYGIVRFAVENRTDGLKNGTETCRGKFLSVLNVNFSAFYCVYSVCMSWNIKEITEVDTTFYKAVHTSIRINKVLAGTRSVDPRNEFLLSTPLLFL